MDVPKIKQVFQLALQAGELLLANGATSSVVEGYMRQIPAWYGLPQCHPNVIFTSLSLSLDHPDLAYPLTEIRRVRKREVNYARLLRILALVEQFQRQQARPEQALAELKTLANEAFAAPWWLYLLSWAAACAASALLLKGNLIEIVVCFLIVLPAQFCKQWIARRAVPAPFGDFCAACVVTVLTLAVSATPLTLRTDIVIAGSLFGLLPGAAIVSSAQELMSGDLLSSAARGLEGLLIGAAIAAGVGFTLDIGTHLFSGAQVSHASAAGWSWPWQLLAACVASLCYGLVSTLPKRTLLFAGLIGGCGWLSALLVSQGKGQELLLATLFATFVIGCLSHWIAAAQRISFPFYTLPGVFPFLPGATVYQGMLAIVQGQDTRGLVLLVQAITIAGVIAMGIALSSLFVLAFGRLRPASRLASK